MSAKQENQEQDMQQQEGNAEPVETGEEGLKSAAEIAFEKAQQELAEGGSPGEDGGLREELHKMKENWLRTQADFDNYRKRVARERQDLIRTANEKLLSELLRALDSFEMGLQTLSSLEENNPVRQGMEMVYSQFQQFLKSQGVTEIETQGAEFDPSIHEAIGHQESDVPEGQIHQQVRKGYRMGDKLLRPASVIVSKGAKSGDNPAPS
jgi:molecular chaperone GrpE